MQSQGATRIGGGRPRAGRLASVSGSLGTLQRSVASFSAVAQDEGAEILKEGIATRPSDIDVVWFYGHGWPIYRARLASST